MKLQLALDILPLQQALELTETLRDFVDRIEIGTPFLLEHGMEAVRLFRARFPEKELLADTKIMDAGALEADSAFRAGADFVTVLALADNDTILSCINAAGKAGKRVVADLICVPDLAAKAVELEALGIHGLAVHTGVDQQKKGRTPLADLHTLRLHSSKAELSVAGGISRLTAAEYCAERPDVLIVGGGIVGASDPRAEAMVIHEILVNA